MRRQGQVCEDHHLKGKAIDVGVGLEVNLFGHDLF